MSALELPSPPTHDGPATLAGVAARIDLPTRRLVESVLEGQHRSFLAGKSMDFRDLRDYVPGDDLSDIDWKATARTGKLSVARHDAMRRATVLIVLGAGPEMTGMATPTESKQHVVGWIVAYLVQIALARGDYVSLVCGDGRTVQVSRAARRRVAGQLLVERARECGTGFDFDAGLDGALDTARTLSRMPAVAVVIGQDSVVTAERKGHLRALTAHCDTYAMTVPDVDLTNPHVVSRGVRPVGASPTIDSRLLDDTELATQISAARAERARVRDTVMASSGIRHVEVADTSRIAVGLQRLFRGRTHA